MPHADLAALLPPPAVPQPPTRRPPVRLRTGALAFLGAVALATAAPAAQAQVGGASPTTSSAAAPAKRAAVTLRHGSRGALVRRLQRKLGVRADGHFGSRTRAALQRWQRRHGIRADGVAGPATLRALRITARAADVPAAPAGVGPVLARIAECESGGNPAAVSATGRYRGKYQFSRETWTAMGGKGDDPAQAPEAEQDRVAGLLYAAQGLKPWPACGRKL